MFYLGENDCPNTNNTNNLHSDLVANSGNASYGIWIGMTLANAADAFNSPKYWTDQANRYLQSGDFGYGKVNHISMFPWGGNQPDGSPSPANVFLPYY